MLQTSNSRTHYIKMIQFILVSFEKINYFNINHLVKAAQISTALGIDEAAPIF